MCEEHGVDLIFHPTVEEMYGDNFYSYVDMNVLTQELCGLTRPVHFRGVCTVVTKLFNIVTPDKAYFGQKDAQQLAIIKRMVKDLNMPLEIVGCPIVREVDRLAKSSRNTYLSEEERKAALVLSRAVFMAKEMAEQGERGSGVMCLNGAAARMVQTGDKIILMAYTQVTPAEAKTLRPTVLFVDDKNQVTKVTNYEKHEMRRLAEQLQ